MKCANCGAPVGGFTEEDLAAFRYFCGPIAHVGRCEYCGVNTYEFRPVYAWSPVARPLSVPVAPPGAKVKS